MTAIDLDTRRRVLTGGNPDASYPVPSDEAFAQYETEWLEANDLNEIVQALITHHDARFVHLSGMSIACRWKRKGGESQQRSRLAKCVKVPAMWAAITRMDFVIWVAADHTRDWNFTRWQMEALLFHELHHATIDERGKAAIVGHDIEEFAGVLLEYGPWHEELRRHATVFEQLPLFEGGTS